MDFLNLFILFNMPSEVWYTLFFIIAIIGLHIFLTTVLGVPSLISLALVLILAGGLLYWLISSNSKPKPIPKQKIYY